MYAFDENSSVIFRVSKRAVYPWCSFFSVKIIIFKLQLTQKEREDIENITQDEYAEIITSNFNSNKIRLTQIEYEEIGSITQEEYHEILSTNFSPQKKRTKRHEDATEEKNVFIIKNCTVNIYNK